MDNQERILEKAYGDHAVKRIATPKKPIAAVILSIASPVLLIRSMLRLAF